MSFRDLLRPFGVKPKPADTGPNYADLYSRGLAASIDLSIVYLILSQPFDRIMSAIYAHIDANIMAQINPDLGAAHMLEKMWQAQFIQCWVLNFAVQIFFIGVLYIGFQLMYATTPGRWLLGIKIVRVGTEESPSAWRFPLRFIGYFFSCAPLMLGVIWAGFRKDRRTWHDLIAGTAVINTRPRGWYWQQLKRGYRYLRGRANRLMPVKEPVAEPAAEQRHQDGA